MNVNFIIDINISDENKADADIKMKMGMDDVEPEVANALSAVLFRIVNSSKKMFQKELYRIYGNPDEYNSVTQKTDDGNDDHEQQDPDSSDESPHDE